MAVRIIITLDSGAGLGRPTSVGDKSRAQGGDLTSQTALEDPDEGIRTTYRCVVQHRSEVREGNGDFELSFICYNITL